MAVEEKIVAMFSGGDQAVCRSLFSWANEGRTPSSELDYTPTEVSTETFLRVFEAIFDNAGHPAHYAMMMKSAGRAFARAGACAARGAPVARLIDLEWIRHAALGRP